MQKPWYQTAFQSHYADLYSHRNRADARHAVDFILSVADPATLQGPVLDLCCGSGRHLHEWREAMPQSAIYGLDLSADLLKLAAAELDSKTHILARADMRHLPFASRSFQLVINLFNSFGYFEEDSENERVLSEVSRLLKPGGLFIIEHMNPHHVRRHLQPSTERTTPGGTHVSESRRIDESRKRVEKEVDATFPDGQHLHLLESVRLYEPDEMISIAAKYGLLKEKMFGNFDLSDWDTNSPRALYLFHRQ